VSQFADWKIILSPGGDIPRAKLRGW